MADQTVTFRGTREDLAGFLRTLPAVLAGNAPDPHGIGQGLKLRLGVALLSKVQQAFIAKSRGGTGEDGITWPALKRETVAQRRSPAGERKALGVGGKRVRGLLTPAQDKRWRLIFARQKASLQARYGLGDAEAAAVAAKVAWATLKREGARTKLEALGGRQVDMCRDTNRYFGSLAPGVEDRPSGADGQVFRVEPGRVVVGSNVEYAAAQHQRRPLWPPDGQLPDAWWDHLLGVAARGLVRALAVMVGGGKP
jgi:hypothetical protein